MWNRHGRVPIYFSLLLIHILLAVVFLLNREPGTNAAVTGFPLDDAWIHLVYGQSIAHSGLPYYNAGELEAGFTSPVWIGVLGVAEFVGGVLPISAVMLVKMFGVLCGWFMSIGMYELCRRIIKQQAAAILGGVMIAAYPAFAFAQLSGMEVCLATALTLWAVVLWLDGRFWRSGILLALSYLTRPETIILTAVIAVAQTVSLSGDVIGTRVRKLVKLVAPVALAGALWCVYCLIVTGHPLPNTFYAKFNAGNFAVWFGNLLSSIVIQMPTMFVFAGVLAYVIGLVVMWRKKTWKTLVVVAYPWVFLASIAMSREMPSMCGSYFYWLRYALPAMPFILAIMVTGVSAIWQPEQAGISMNWWLGHERWWKIAAVTLAVLLFTKYPTTMARERSQFAWNCQNINEVQVEFGKWVKRTVPREAAVLVNDAGAIRYFGEHKTIDLGGLNNQQLLFDLSLWRDVSQKPESLVEYMRRQKADYFVAIPSWFPVLLNDQGFGQRFVPVKELGSSRYTITSFPQSQMIAFGLHG